MKKLMMFAIISCISTICSAKDRYKLKYVDDGQGGKISYFYCNGKLQSTINLDANMWATLQRHWTTGEPLPDCQAAIAKQVAEGQEKTDAAWHEWHDKQLVKEQQQQVQVVQKTAEQAQQDYENLFLSDEMYNVLWSELLDYEETQNIKHDGGHWYKAFRHAYGDHWWKLSYASRKQWVDYFYPKIDWGTIDQRVEENRKWQKEAAQKAYEEAQQQFGGSSDR